MLEELKVSCRSDFCSMPSEKIIYGGVHLSWSNVSLRTDASTAVETEKTALKIACRLFSIDLSDSLRTVSTVQNRSNYIDSRCKKIAFRNFFSRHDF